MRYPIFSSIVNTIDQSLNKRGIATKKFKTWEDNRINASGLEIAINLSRSSKYINTLSINLDWDKFKEARLAILLEGMDNHPVLKELSEEEIKVPPIVDIEMAWKFDVDKCQPVLPGVTGNYRIENASRWMESISREMNEMLANDDIITRWHVEADGDRKGRYLSAINLISYFQYNMSELSNLNDINRFLNLQIHDLLRKANKVIYQSDHIITETIAA
jgi:hypothetical protein